MKLIELPQVKHGAEGYKPADNIFINPEYVVAINPTEHEAIKHCCDVLLHTQGTAIVSLPTQEVAELLFPGAIQMREE